MGARKMSILALFITLSVVGAAIKIPAILGSVALDSFPSLLAAAFLGAVPGAIVGGFGHIISALIGGMPLGPLHFIIALEMALLVFIFAMLFRRGKKLLASILFVIGNAFVSPIPFIYLFDLTFYFALLPSLFLGSLLNTAIAWVIIPRLTTKFKGFSRGEVKG